MVSATLSPLAAELEFAEEKPSTDVYKRQMLPFLDITNEILRARGVKLPLEGEATTTMEDRLEKGAQAQVDIFGEGMKDAWKKGHINRWLAANCFGDYYTRKGLDYRQREMITFCFLACLLYTSRCV